MASFGGKIELQGESEYRKALKDITANLKLVSSELKLTNTEFSNGDKSVKQAKTSYDSMNNTMQEQRAKVDELRETIKKMEQQYGSNNEKVKTFKTQLNEAEIKLIDMENATDKSTKELKEMQEGFDDAGKGASTFADVLKANLTSEVIIGGIKALGSAVASVGKAFVNIGSQAIEGFADFEQLEGGVKKLFGDDMAKTVISNANNAFKTAGMTANEYMETVTSFSASLINSLGGDTAKATEYADIAIQDMADNANTFGTDISMIQNAYQGFAKGNFTMLDNLKLGYGGTKTEMERLLADASKISGIKYDISSFSDITQAIHVMQQKMNIAGTTSMEASKTISGSISSMKSAWSNLITGLADEGADLSQLLNNIIESVFGKDGEGGVLNNILPRISQVVDSIVALLPVIVEKIVEFMPQLLQTGMDILQKIMDGITTLIPQLMPVVIDIINTLVKFIVENLPTIINAGIQILLSLIQGVADSLPELIPVLVDAVLLIVETLIDNIDLIIDAGIQILLALIDGIIDALPRLIEKMPVIIEKLVNALVENFPKIVKAGGELLGKLISGILSSLSTLLLHTPKIIDTLVKGLKDGLSAIKNVGKDLISGMWEGIQSKWNSLKESVTNLGSGIVNKFKSVFGINSPSRVFRDEVGNYLAEGVGVGFEETMADVSKDMANSIPTEFDTNVNMSSSSNASSSNYDLMVSAFETALKNVKVVMNDREMGTFVTDTMTRVVYS